MVSSEGHKAPSKDPIGAKENTMTTVSGKYTMIKQATARMNAINADYEIWLDYQKSKGLVLVREVSAPSYSKPIVYVILARPMDFYTWCKQANSLTAEGYSVVLLNSQELITNGN